MVQQRRAVPQQGKYAWVDIDYHNFTPRASWEAAALPKLGKLFDGLDHDSEPWRFFAACDAPEQEYRDRATNSEKYRYHRFIKDLDGPGKKFYDGAADITYADMRYLDAALLLNGLDPAVSHQTRSAPLLPNFSHAPLGAVRAHVSRSGRSPALGICPRRDLHAYVRSYGPQGPPEEHAISARSRPLREVDIAPRSPMPHQVPAGRIYVHRRAERATGISLAPKIVPNGSHGRAPRRAARR